MNEIRDVYNKLYIYTNNKFDKKISEKDKEIDNAIRNFFSDKGIEPQTVSASDTRLMKAKIIQTYKSHGKVPTQLDRAVHVATEQVEKKLMLREIPATPIKFQPIANYEENKAVYLEKVKTSSDDEDKRLVKYLENPHVQMVAASMEKDLYLYSSVETRNSNLYMTTKDFAQFLLDYSPVVETIFEKMGKEEPGADDRQRMYLAITLLQTGDHFANGAVALKEYLEKSDDTRIYRLITPLISMTSHAVNAVDTIQNFDIKNS